MKTYEFLERELKRYQAQQMYYREQYRAAKNKWCIEYEEAVAKAKKAYEMIVSIECLMNTYMSEAIEEFNYQQAVEEANQIGYN